VDRRWHGAFSCGHPEMKTRLKDFAYDRLPLPLVGAVLRRTAGESSPFIPAVEKAQAIFIHVPKAAGSSIKTKLYGQPQGGHRRISEYYAFDPVRAAAFFKFAFVRNPWDRLVSAYAYLTEGLETRSTSGRDRRFAETTLLHAGDFTAFVLALENRRYRRQVMEYDHFRTQSDWVCLPGQREHAMDFVGRFERMEEGMEEVCVHLGLPQVALTRERTSTHAPYREAYTGRTRTIAAEVYAEDAARFGYAF
jgi:hypothetical protein